MAECLRDSRSWIVDWRRSWVGAVGGWLGSLWGGFVRGGVGVGARGCMFCVFWGWFGNHLIPSVDRWLREY